MPSPILPISNPSSRYSPPTMPPILVSKADDDDPTTRLLISSYDDDKAMQVRPLLSRASSYSSTMTMNAPAVNGHQRRRRVTSESCLASLSSSGREDGDSLEGEVDRATAETFLLTRLSLKLWRYIGYDCVTTHCLWESISFLPSSFQSECHVLYYLCFNRRWTKFLTSRILREVTRHLAVYEVKWGIE